MKFDPQRRASVVAKGRQLQLTRQLQWHQTCQLNTVHDATGKIRIHQIGFDWRHAVAQVKTSELNSPQVRCQRAQLTRFKTRRAAQIRPGELSGEKINTLDVAIRQVGG